MNKITRWYIENLGDQTLGDRIMELAADDSGISERLGMKCLDRRGNHIKRNLYEVPVNVRNQIMRMARKAGFQFVIYRQIGENLPKEYFSQLTPVRINPFKEARAQRRKLKWPAGVVSGSSLLRSLQGVQPRRML